MHGCVITLGSLQQAEADGWLLSEPAEAPAAAADEAPQPAAANGHADAGNKEAAPEAGNGDSYAKANGAAAATGTA